MDACVNTQIAKRAKPCHLILPSHFSVEAALVRAAAMKIGVRRLLVVANLTCMISTWGAFPKYGDYRIVLNDDGSARLLGEGGFGKTFQATRTDPIAGREIKTHVALKVLNPRHLQDERKRSQLIREIEALTQVDHPNLIRYVGCGEESDEIFYAMGLCRGGDLTSLSARFGPLPERAAAQIALQVASGLRELGRRNMVHRDIKPSNVMLAEAIDVAVSADDLAGCIEAHESLIRLVDFGLVNLQEESEQTGQGFAGSPMYASPEQLREQPLDARSDIYSLGMTLWRLVEGRGPLLDKTGTSEASVADAVCRHLDPDDFHSSLPSSLSGEFKRLLMQMVAKNRDERFASAADLLRAVRSYLSRTAIISTEPSQDAPVEFKDAAQPLDTLFTIGKVLSGKRGRKSYEAVDRAREQNIRLTLLASIPADTASADALQRNLEQIASVTRDPGCPAALFKVLSLLKSGGQFVCVEPLFSPISLTEILKARSTGRRPAAFPEAALILRPIAAALDHLMEHGLTSLLLRSDDIWLRSTGAAAQAGAAEASFQFGAMDVRFSAMFAPPELLDENQESLGTSTGSLAMSADDHHPVAAFARLIYRIVNGSEVPAVARMSPDGYPPTVALGAGSNALLRDCINRRKVARTASLLLKELCANEGVLIAGGESPSKAAGNAPQESVRIPIPSAAALSVSARHDVGSQQSAAQARPTQASRKRSATILAIGALAAMSAIAGAGIWLHSAMRRSRAAEAPPQPTYAPVRDPGPPVAAAIPVPDQPPEAPPAKQHKQETAPVAETPAAPPEPPAPPAAPKIDSASYFPIQPGSDWGYDAVTTNIFGARARGTGRIVVTGASMSNGKKYSKLEEGSTWLPAALVLERVDESGSYMLAQDGREVLQCPFPLTEGASWTYNDGTALITSTLTGFQDLPIGGRTLRNCCCIESSVNSGVASGNRIWRAPGVGIVSAEYLYRTGVQVSFVLRRHKLGPPEASASAKPQSAAP